MSSLKKLEFHVEIEAPAHLFYDVLTYKAHSLSTMTPETIQKCTIEPGNEGTVVSFDYIDGGKKKTCKDIIEKIDDKNLSTTWKVIEGDLLNEYKSFKLIMKAVPKDSGGSLVQWSFEYENNKEGSPDLHSLVEYCVNSCMGIDIYLSNAQLNS